MMTTTLAQALVLNTLSPTYPLTPADIKRRLPGKVPVAVIRDLLQDLKEDGLAHPSTSSRQPGVTAWVSVL